MLGLAAMVFAIFFAIEILPLHYGPKQLPWHEIIPIFKERLPVILLIASGVALVLGTREESKKD